MAQLVIACGNDKNDKPVPLMVDSKGRLPISVSVKVNLWQFAAALLINDIVIIAAFIIVRLFYG
jgi:hypothetical protein